MMRRFIKNKTLFIVVAFAVIWSVAAITLGLVLLSGYEFSFDFDDFYHTVFPGNSNPLPADGIIPSARVDVIDVGQGSSTLIQLYGNDPKAVLIDAGEEENSDKIRYILDDSDISKLDFIIITHPHSDHFGGAIDLLSRYKVGELWMPDIPVELTPTNAAYSRFLEALDKNGCSLIIKDSVEVFDMGNNITLSILDGFIDSPSNLNDTSLCIRLDVGEASFLITGDGEYPVEKQLISQNAYINCDILVAGHHGSNTSSNHEFLNAVTPIASVISVGKNNDYGHPSPQAYERLANFGPVYRTDINGTVTFFTDGESISVSAGEINDLLDARR